MTIDRYLKNGKEHGIDHVLSLFGSLAIVFFDMGTLFSAELWSMILPTEPRHTIILFILP